MLGEDPRRSRSQLPSPRLIPDAPELPDSCLVSPLAAAPVKPRPICSWAAPGATHPPPLPQCRALGLQGCFRTGLPSPLASVPGCVVVTSSLWNDFVSSGLFGLLITPCRGLRGLSMVSNHPLGPSLGPQCFVDLGRVIPTSFTAFVASRVSYFSNDIFRWIIGVQRQGI